MSEKKPPQTPPSLPAQRPAPDPGHKILDHVEKRDPRSPNVIMDTHQPPPPKPDNKP